MGRKKELVPARSFRDLLLATVAEFTEGESEAAREVTAAIQDDEVADLEEAEMHLASTLEEHGIDADAFFVCAMGKLDAIPAKSIRKSHMSVLEAIVDTRIRVVPEQSEKPEHVAFALARLVTDNLRTRLLIRVGSAETYEHAIARALSLAWLSLAGKDALEKKLQDKLRELQGGEGFLRKVYEKVFAQLREELTWRTGLAENLADVLDSEQCAQIRENGFSFSDGVVDPPSQAFMIYRTLYFYWLPQKGVERPGDFLSERGIENPEPHRRMEPGVYRD